MNQESNNLNQNNFNTQGNNGMPNNQSLQNNQSFNNAFNPNAGQNSNVIEPTFNPQPPVEPFPQVQSQPNQQDISQIIGYDSQTGQPIYANQNKNVQTKIQNTNNIYQQQHVRQNDNISEKSKIDKLKYISLVLIIMCGIYPLLSLPLSGFYFFNRSISVVLFFCSLTSLILNIILFIKKRKSAILYICSVFSIIIFLLSGNYVIYDTQRLLAYYTNYDTEEDKQYKMEQIETIVNYDVESYLGNYLNEPLPNTSNTVLISKELYEGAIRLGNEKLRENKKNPETAELYKDIEEKESVYQANGKHGYVCDGYTVLQRFYSEQECMDAVNNSKKCSGYDKNYKKGETYVQTFIKCTGRYKYQTDGFDEEKLNKSKNNKEEYINLGFKELEYNFNQSVLHEFEWNLKLDDITYKIINKNEYELEVINNYEDKSVFSKEKYTNYVCDGYVEISLDETINEYVGKPYISCTGEKNYQTDGFDNAKFNS